MRTYTRKRPPSGQVIDGVQKLCRLCLITPVSSVAIFADNSGVVYSSLANRIMICVGLEVTNEEYLPNIICVDCHSELERIYTFRKKCQTSYLKLKSHIRAIKGKDYKTKVAVDATTTNISLDDNLNTGNGDNVICVINLDGRLELDDQKSHKPLIHEINKSTEDVGNEAVVQNNALPVLSDAVNEGTVAKDRIMNETENNDIQTENQLPDLQISQFLSCVLVDLGILTHQDGGLVMGGHIRNFHLEMGDGSQVNLELLEEDDEPEEVSSYPKEENKDSELFIQYIDEKDSKGSQSNNSKMCPECGRTLASRGALARHVRAVHRRQRPHVCGLCSRAFAQREVLLRHQLVHQVQRPFPCGACGKSYTQRGALAAHARTHTPPHARALRLHACPAPRCGKAFLYASGLSRHMWLHNGRRYSCGGCKRQFKDKSSLKRHQRSTGHVDGT